MKHAINLLMAGMDKARLDEIKHREAKDAKAAKTCQAIAWDCLDGIELIRREIAVRKAAKKKGGQP